MGAVQGILVMLADSLRKIVEDTPGATGAILMGFDGIAVMQHLAKGHEKTDIESLAMEFSFRFIELRKAALSLEMGEINDITIKAEAGSVLCRVLSEEYFVAVVLHDSAHFGKGRWMLRSCADELIAEL
ncbi:MAG: roadblock/LC7 domain-containing protein [Deltaproteobacteria bacterium]|nr:roadblock/LC7 domain-containing protein [Deltaproteobacteria bacterium]